MMNAGTPLVSIIIPCYNHGNYILDTIASIEAIEDKSLYEVIIVNDGSTDGTTGNILKEFDRTRPDNYTVIFQENQGVCATRNNAISKAKGMYILPLDADNKLYPDYLYKAVEIFKSDPEVSVVYSNGKLTGSEQGVRYQMDFNLHALLTYNYIDTCAVYKKTLWEELGGYDANMKWGLEDWEFWLHAKFKGHKFHHIDEELFEYRVEDNLRTKKLFSDGNNINKLMDYMIGKHAGYYGPQFVTEYLLNKFRQHPVSFIRIMVIHAYFPKLFNKLVQRGKLRKYI